MSQQRRDIEGQMYDMQASHLANLKWSSIEKDVIIKGDSDLTSLANLKNILLTLREEFRVDGPKISFAPQKRDEFAKRLLLLENQIQGMMKRRINYSVKDLSGGERVLDYTNLLNQKQNQVVELEKKIQNLEERLRRSSARQIQLQNHILHLNQQLHNKEGIILSKNQVILAEVAFTNLMRDTLNKVKKNIDFNRTKLGDFQKIIMDGVVMPEIGSFQIKSDVLNKDKSIGRSRAYQSQPQAEKLKTKIIQMFRQIERLTNQPEGITEKQVQKILEGFLIEFNSSRLYQRVKLSISHHKLQQDYIRLRDNFAIASGVYQSNLQRLKNDNPNIRINLDNKIFDILRAEKVQAYVAENGIVFVDAFVEKTVQVPVQDARTKHLLHLLAVQMKKLVSKYPKLRLQIDGRLCEFFEQQLIDVIEVDEMQKLVQIVKYVPQVVKVENVYAYSNEKSRKVEFHLRILVKALMEQLEKIKIKSGLVLQIDEGVVGMIRQQIMGVVDVDDILKVFRVVPKIVEVEKIVEKIVERVVEVPQVITIQKIIEKIVQVEKIKQVQRIVNVPLEIPVVVDHHVEKIVPIQNITERIVEVPTVIDRVVELIRQVPKIVEVKTIEDRIVEVDKIIEVQRVVNHIQVEVREVEIVKQKIVTVQKIIQKIVEVPVIVEKIVERIIEVPKIIQIQKIVEKIVPQIQYRNARQIANHIEIQHTIVDRIIQKPVPIIQYVQKILQVPTIIEKIIIQTNTIREPYPVQVIKQKLIIEEKIREVQKINTQIIQVIKEVIKEVEVYIQVPVVHQILVKVQQFIQKPVIQRVQTTIVKEVYLRDPIIVKQPKIVEVEVIVNHYIEVPKIIRVIEEKIVQVPRHIDRIKEVRVQIQKIIQKMVEVPKVVEVEKIVEKVVVVPRIIQKVVQVPQIVQKIVQKEIIREVIREVEKIVQVPVIQQKVVEVEVSKNVFIEVQRVVEKIMDKLVEVPKYQEKIITQEVIVEKVVEILREVPKNIEVEKVVPQVLQTIQIIQIQKPIVIPIEVPVPVDRIIQKLVPYEHVIERIVQVPQIKEKIVDRMVEVVKIQQIEKTVEKVVIDKEIHQVQKIVPYIQQVIKEIPITIQKIVPVYTTVQQIVTAHQIIQKVVEKAITVPKVYEVERIQQVLVQVPKFIQMERIVPQLVRVNNYIQRLVQKIVEVPIIIEQMKEIVTEREKIVTITNENTKILQVQRAVEHVVVMQKIKEVVRNINHIEKVLQIVDRYEQIPVQILSHHERLIEVPYILEKIVQKVIVMPQIVQVLKYVHEVCESQELGVAVGVQVAVHQQQYRALSKGLKGELDLLVRELRGIKSGSTEVRGRIEVIEKFLGELQKFILFPKIVKVVEEKIVEKQIQVEKIVRIPVQDERSLRMELSLTLLVQKLITEIKRVQTQNKINLQLDDDIKLIFFAELNSRNKFQGQMAQKLQQFSTEVYRKFQSLGPWSVDHQLMLNSFLQERFAMAEIVHTANLQIEKAKQVSQKRLETLRRYKNDKIAFGEYLDRIRNTINTCGIDLKAEIGDVYRVIDQYANNIQGQIREPMRVLGQIQINNNRVQSMIRQKDQQIYRLKDMIRGNDRKTNITSTKVIDESSIKSLKAHNEKLTSQINDLNAKLIEEGLTESYREQINQLHQTNFQLETKISELTAELLNTQNQMRLRYNLDEGREFSHSRINQQSHDQSSFLSGSRQTALQSARRQQDSAIRDQDNRQAQRTPQNTSTFTTNQPYEVTSATYGLNRPTNSNLQIQQTTSIIGTPQQITTSGLGSARLTSSHIKEGQSTLIRSPGDQFSSPSKIAQSGYGGQISGRSNISGQYETPLSQRQQSYLPTLSQQSQILQSQTRQYTGQNLYPQPQTSQLQGTQGSRIIQGTQLQGTQLQGTQLQGSQLQGSQLQGSQLQGSQLQGSQLQGSQLQGQYQSGFRRDYPYYPKKDEQNK